MAETDTPLEEPIDAAAEAAPEDDDALRKRLLSRIAVAGVVIVGLLGGLAVFDSLNRPQAPALPKMAVAPEEAPAKVEEEKPAETAPAPQESAAAPTEEKTAEAKPEETKTEEAKLAAAPAVPESSAPPTVAVPKAPKPAKPLTPPATARQAGIRPSEPAAAPVQPDARREIARAAAPKHAPASRPLTQAAEAVRRFLVQVGVFSNPANAEEMVQKLQAAGIPAQIESHVQVGPFASRADADAARAKLKALGIDGGILVRR